MLYVSTRRCKFEPLRSEESIEETGTMQVRNSTTGDLASQIHDDKEKKILWLKNNDNNNECTKSNAK